ncbi:class I SAM-dependent methyltransferase [Amycolatopsis sp. NPDC058986]|uniref:class I SAM-dependent methyltransferase n=1 Tax=unclassified Amycolatopsis TaxID=2618356 RepID=UPI00366BAEC0
MTGEHDIVRYRLAPRYSAAIPALGCGLGLFTSPLADAVGANGLVVGVDNSRNVIDHATQPVSESNVVSVRADVSALPFRDSAFDAVYCLGTLDMSTDPMRTLNQAVRVLIPGGRLVIVASRLPNNIASPVLQQWYRRAFGRRLFGHSELTGALEDRRIEQIGQHIAGFTQFVWGRRPKT